MNHRKISDTIDLSVSVSRSDRGSQVRFVWKTHNLHVIDTLPEGFSLGNLNVGKRREHTVETQIPILEMGIKPPASERRTLFSGGEEEGGELEVSFRVNRSWIEKRPSPSDAQLDSTFASPLEFLDFLSDHAHNDVYALLMRLIGDVSEVLSGYLESKRQFIQGLEL